MNWLFGRTALTRADVIWGIGCAIWLREYWWQSIIAFGLGAFVITAIEMWLKKRGIVR